MEGHGGRGRAGGADESEVETGQRVAGVIGAGRERLGSVIDICPHHGEVRPGLPEIAHQRLGRHGHGVRAAAAGRIGPAGVAVGVGGAHPDLVVRAGLETAQPGRRAGDILRAVGPGAAAARAVLDVVAGDRGPAGVGGRGPAHREAVGRAQRCRHDRGRGSQRGLSAQVDQLDRDRVVLGPAQAGVVPDPPVAAAARTLAVGEREVVLVIDDQGQAIRPGDEVGGDREIEPSRAGADQQHSDRVVGRGIGERAVVEIGVAAAGDGAYDIGATAIARPADHSHGQGGGPQRGRGGIDLEDLREPVQGEAERLDRNEVGVERAAARVVGPADGNLTRAQRSRYAIVEVLGAIVAAAGVGPVGYLGGVGAVGAGRVLVVGLVVPGPVVEVLVLVGDLVAVEPVDADALVGRGVGGGGVVAGVGGGGAADHPEAIAVGPDVGVPGRGALLDEGVVGRDVGGLGSALRGGEEQQPELVAPGQAGGLEAPALGDHGRGAGVLGGGGRRMGQEAEQGQGGPRQGRATTPSGGARRDSARRRHGRTQARQPRRPGFGCVRQHRPSRGGIANGLARRVLETVPLRTPFDERPGIGCRVDEARRSVRIEHRTAGARRPSARHPTVP